MTAAIGIVIRQGEIETAVGIEVDELHAVRRVMLQDHIGQRLGETLGGGAVDEERIAIERLAGDEVADIQIGQPVVVEIAPRRGHAVAVQTDAARARDLEERAAVAAVERARPVVRDEQIEIAVEIEVGHARSNTAVFSGPRHAGHAEAVAATSSKRPPSCRYNPLGLPLLIGDEEIQIAVAVVIPPHAAHAAASIADA